ncbi:hypothetical protein CANMA_004431 [Candida margitis]|uniref:uncharacterized protein n=1 Tax=Candida margitis TaxID=1775924 RepID=UPI002226FD07|nr:uncharacterized protein CANMA_004431 [Candida margitis]KAI5957427.1 hypothetical protein CANMA_004431 [Candida margitis]
MIVPSPSTRALNELMSSSIYNYLEQVESKHQLNKPQQRQEPEPHASQPVKPVYQRILGHPSLHSWVKWVIILYIVRLQNPIQWANFVSLNKPIRQLLSYYRGSFSGVLGPGQRKASPSPNATTKLANCITCVFLYFATVDSKAFPKDYALVSLLSAYHGELNPPSKSQILVSDSFSKPFKLSTYRSSGLYQPLMKIYQNKECIIFPVLYAQILSNYLTPTKYKLNMMYLSPFLKRYILNPIWINFSLGRNYSRINWKNLVANYLLHNVVVAAAVAGYSFKDRILDRFYAIKYGHGKPDSESSILQNYTAYVFHKASSITNFIYAPNLISILLIAVSASLFSTLGSNKHPQLHRFYMHNQKSVFKTYTKTIGLLAGLAAIKLNHLQLVPDWGYNKRVEAEHAAGNSADAIYEEDVEEEPAARLLSKQFYNDLNMYLFKLVVLSKWRILKTYHPLFSKVQLPLWNKLETALMCFGFLKMMNLSDFVNGHRTLESERISKDSMIRVANFVSQ